MEHVQPLAVGLNCSLGPDLMYPFLRELSEKADVAISCYPNAGLPNPLVARLASILEPADMARYLGGFAREGLINIAGGCCGNTPEHIAAIAKALEGVAPRKMPALDEAESFGSRGQSMSTTRVSQQSARVETQAAAICRDRSHSRSSPASTS